MSVGGLYSQHYYLGGAMFGGGPPGPGRLEWLEFNVDCFYFENRKEKEGPKGKIEKILIWCSFS